MDCVVEFGLNERKTHLENDIRRLSDPRSRVDQGYVVNLYRLSRFITERDWVNLRNDRATIDFIHKYLGKVRNVVGYYALCDDKTGEKDGPWRIDGKMEPILLQEDE